MCMLARWGNRVVSQPCKVDSSVFRSRVRQSLLTIIMSTSQHLQALVCYRKDRMAPALRLLQQVRLLATVLF